jgi:cyanate permease
MTILAVPPVILLIQTDLSLSGTEVGILSGLPVILFGIAALPGSLLVARFGATVDTDQLTARVRALTESLRRITGWGRLFEIAAHEVLLRVVQARYLLICSVIQRAESARPSHLLVLISLAACIGISLNRM